MDSLFEAARAGNLSEIQQGIANGFDINQFSKYGFTLLQTAALGSNLVEPALIFPLIQFLVESGSDLALLSKDGRSTIFLMAEFSPSVKPIELLISAGADPSIRDSYGNHIVKNALTEESQAYLSKLTGEPIYIPEPEPKQVKMKGSAWKKAQKDITLVFEQLTQKGLIALQDAGYTQQDGFQDCVEILHEQPKPDAIKGFCFYTRQDQNTAKRTSRLMLGIWGAPDGDDASILKTGKIICDCFSENGFECDWNESASYRPTILLHSYTTP